MSQELNKSAVMNLAQLDYILELNHPEYTGIRMDKELRAKLVNIREKMQGPGKASNRRLSLYRHMADYFGREKVYFGPTMPDWYLMPDIVFCANEKGEAIDLPKKFVKQLEDATELIKPPTNLVENGYRCFCLILASWQDSNLKGELFGNVNFKAHQLMKLGYTIRIIQPKNLDKWLRHGKIGEIEISFIINAMNQEKYLKKW